MAVRTVDFDAQDLAAKLEQLTHDEIDALPFGAVHLDCEFTVVLYSKPEARQSGFGRQPFGERFFSLARKLDSENFRGRIERAMADGPVDLEFGWVGDYEDPRRELRIRVQSARDGGVWICFERDVKKG